MVKQLIVSAVLVAAVAACGGKQPGPMTPDADRSDERGEPGPINDSDNAATMVPPEKMEEITRLLDRKQRIMSRCLADAVDAQELPKNSRGRITLELVISPAGKADPVKVIKSSLESPRLADCVIGHVREIQFPTLPKSYPTSYTYAFEAM